MDVLFFNEIKFNLQNRQKDVLYTNDCNTPLSYQFEYRDEYVGKMDSETYDKFEWINKKWGYWGDRFSLTYLHFKVVLCYFTKI